VLRGKTYEKQALLWWQPRSYAKIHQRRDCWSLLYWPAVRLLRNFAAPSCGIILSWTSFLSLLSFEVQYSILWSLFQIYPTYSSSRLTLPMRLPLPCVRPPQQLVVPLVGRYPHGCKAAKAGRCTIFQPADVQSLFSFKCVASSAKRAPVHERFLRNSIMALGI